MTSSTQQSKTVESAITKREAALDYASRGWLVFPCHSIELGRCSCKQACSSPGKHPRTQNGLKDATTDGYKIADWWRERPDANVAIVTGSELGIIVIDIDPDHGGREALDALEAEHGSLPPTVEAVTGGDGFHLLFNYPGVDIRNRTNLRPGIDVRGDGGYIVASPSNHISGGYYWWDENRGPGEIDLADIPAWLLKLLTSPPAERHQTNGSVTGDDLLRRASAYVAKTDGCKQGFRNDAAFNLAGHVAAFTGPSGERLSEGQIVDLLQLWNQRIKPPLPDGELRKCVSSALCNGTPREAKPATSKPPGPAGPDDDEKRARAKPIEEFTFAQLRAQYPKLSAPVINGLAREGETINIIADSKVGKSWMGYGLLLSTITGNPWLGQFETTPGKVLLIDNELHRSTLAHRIPKVAEKMGLFPSDYENNLTIWPLRGNIHSLRELGSKVMKIEPGQYKLILFDAKYRFANPEKSENDNAAETEIYNLLDEYSDHTKAVLALIHHASKGSQADKKVTDVGSGAGAQSRAADCHLILREHEDPDTVVLDAAVRSFKPIDPVVLRWNYPLWTSDETADAERLKRKPNKQDQRQASAALPRRVAAWPDGY